MIPRTEPTIMIEQDDGYEQLRHKYRSVTTIDPQDPTGTQIIFLKSPYCSEIAKLYLLSKVSVDNFGHLQLPCQIDFSALIQMFPGRFRQHFMSMRSQKVEEIVQQAHEQSAERFYGMAQLEIRYHMDEMRQLHQKEVNRVKQNGESFEFEADFIACPFAQAVFAFQSGSLTWLLEGYTPTVYKLLHRPTRNCCCGLPRTIQNVLGDLVCGQCFVGRVRKENDYPFIPNTVHDMDVEGLRFNKEQLDRWKELKFMPTLEEQNNIESVVSSRFIFDSHLTWRGDLAGHILKTDLAIIGEDQVPAVQYALMNQRFLALSIRETDWLEGPENFGVFAEKDIEAETAICVYSGEMFFASQLPFWTQNRSSRVKLGFVKSEEVILSPERRANVGRFLNHDNQDNANVRATWVIAETQDDFELILLMISNQDIAAGEELRWCYGIDYVQDHLECTDKKKLAKKGGKGGKRNQRRN